MGATKTASTFLQKSLRLNEKTLLSHGVYLPRAGRRDASANLNHHNLAWDLLGDRRFRSGEGGWETLRAEIADLDAQTVLLSSEAFSRLAGDQDHRRPFA